MYVAHHSMLAACIISYRNKRILTTSDIKEQNLAVILITRIIYIYIYMYAYMSVKLGNKTTVISDSGKNWMQAKKDRRSAQLV